jgi:hypothetical protein
MRPRVLIALAAVVACLCGAAPNSARADEIVTACGGYENHTFLPSASYTGINVLGTCPGGPIALTTNGVPMKDGQGAIWQAVAPPGLAITGASIPANSLLSSGVNEPSGGQYGGYFYWSGGRSNITPGERSASFGSLNSSDFGWLLVCVVSTCTASAKIQVFEVRLGVHETSGPWLASDSGLWQSGGWVRGQWPLPVSGDSPSGLCTIAAKFGDNLLPGSTSALDPSRWHQCGAAPFTDQINTQDYLQGANPAVLGAWDAAGGFIKYTKTVYVDNQTPTVSLSGPSDAASTAGVQYVTARASAGPSGVAGMNCSVDGGSMRWHPAASVQIPVSGVGEHTVKCVAKNNAVNAGGARATSAASSFAMKIGQPTVTAVAFSKLLNGLRCRQVYVRVRRHSHIRRVKVTRCRVRVQRRAVTIWVTVKRHGHRVRIRERRVIRVVLTPRTVTTTQEVVPHGHRAALRGWLGTATGTALAGQAVEVLTAPDDGRNEYTPAALATTASNGSWSAHLPPGPSRLVTASYGGGPTTQSSLAAPARLVVPARVRLLSVRPRRVAWGGTVKLVGDLAGGYLPPGGALVRLRIGIGRAFTTYGVHEHVGGRGRFSTTYTFGVGVPSIKRTYWFQIASLPMGDYPFAPASSRRITVLVGGHPQRGSLRRP